MGTQSGTSMPHAVVCLFKSCAGPIYWIYWIENRFDDFQIE